MALQTSDSTPSSSSCSPSSSSCSPSSSSPSPSSSSSSPSSSPPSSPSSSPPSSPSSSPSSSPPSSPSSSSLSSDSSSSSSSPSSAYSSSPSSSSSSPSPPRSRTAPQGSLVQAPSLTLAPPRLPLAASPGAAPLDLPSYALPPDHSFASSAVCAPTALPEGDAGKHDSAYPPVSTFSCLPPRPVSLQLLSDSTRGGLTAFPPPSALPSPLPSTSHPSSARPFAVAGSLCPPPAGLAAASPASPPCRCASSASRGARDSSGAAGAGERRLGAETEVASVACRSAAGERGGERGNRRPSLLQTKRRKVQTVGAAEDLAAEGTTRAGDERAQAEQQTNETAQEVAESKVWMPGFVTVSASSSPPTPQRASTRPSVDSSSSSCSSASPLCASSPSLGVKPRRAAPGRARWEGPPGERKRQRLAPQKTSDPEEIAPSVLCWDSSPTMSGSAASPPASRAAVAPPPPRAPAPCAAGASPAAAASRERDQREGEGERSSSEAAAAALKPSEIRRAAARVKAEMGEETQTKPETAREPEDAHLEGAKSACKGEEAAGRKLSSAAEDDPQRALPVPRMKASEPNQATTNTPGSQEEAASPPGAPAAHPLLSSSSASLFSKTSSSSPSSSFSSSSSSSFADIRPPTLREVIRLIAAPHRLHALLASDAERLRVEEASKPAQAAKGRMRGGNEETEEARTECLCCEDACDLCRHITSAAKQLFPWRAVVQTERACAPSACPRPTAVAGAEVSGGEGGDEGAAEAGESVVAPEDWYTIEQLRRCDRGNKFFFLRAPPDVTAQTAEMLAEILLTDEGAFDLFVPFPAAHSSPGATQPLSASLETASASAPAEAEATRSPAKLTAEVAENAHAEAANRERSPGLAESHRASLHAEETHPNLGALLKTKHEVETREEVVRAEATPDGAPAELCGSRGSVAARAEGPVEDEQQRTPEEAGGGGEDLNLKQTEGASDARGTRGDLEEEEENEGDAVEVHAAAAERVSDLKTLRGAGTAPPLPRATQCRLHTLLASPCACRVRRRLDRALESLSLRLRAPRCRPNLRLDEQAAEGEAGTGERETRGEASAPSASSPSSGSAASREGRLRGAAAELLSRRLCVFCREEEAAKESPQTDGDQGRREPAAWTAAGPGGPQSAPGPGDGGGGEAAAEEAASERRSEAQAPGAHGGIRGPEDSQVARDATWIAHRLFHSAPAAGAPTSGASEGDPLRAASPSPSASGASPAESPTGSEGVRAPASRAPFPPSWTGGPTAEAARQSGEERDPLFAELFLRLHGAAWRASLLSASSTSPAFLTRPLSPSLLPPSPSSLPPASSPSSSAPSGAPPPSWRSPSPPRRLAVERLLRVEAPRPPRRSFVLVESLQGAASLVDPYFHVRQSALLYRKHSIPSWLVPSPPPDAEIAARRLNASEGPSAPAAAAGRAGRGRGGRGGRGRRGARRGAESASEGSRVGSAGAVEKTGEEDEPEGDTGGGDAAHIVGAAPQCLSTMPPPRKLFRGFLLNHDGTLPQNLASQLLRNREVSRMEQLRQQAFLEAEAVEWPAVPPPERFPDRRRTRYELAIRGKRVKLQKSRIHGYGVFAVDWIRAGEVIMEYVGQAYAYKQRKGGVDGEEPSLAEIREARYDWQHGNCYIFSLDSEKGQTDGAGASSKTKFIDATDSGNLARYINHSCEPNCESVRMPHNAVAIVALRDLLPGEELFYDYHFSDKSKEVCLCGARTCTGNM